MYAQSSVESVNNVNYKTAKTIFTEMFVRNACLICSVKSSITVSYVSQFVQMFQPERFTKDLFRNESE